MRRLAGHGIVLEPQTARDAAELFPVLDDPALYVFTDDKGPASEEALTQRLARLESRRSPDGSQQWLNWVVRTSDGDVAGYVQATVRPDREAEIAYMLGQLFWRHGYAAAACTLMLAELRDGYGVRHVVATLDPQNAASLALLRKLGFQFLEEDADEQEVTYTRSLIP